MNKQHVIDILKTIHYPGFSRDIVSFGMVQDVVVVGEHVAVTLKIATQKDEKKNAVVDAVKKTLQVTNAFRKIDVKVMAQEHAPPPQTTPGPTPLTGIKHIIAVASGKGGVGKSTVAANLAGALMQDKKLKIGLLDLDIYGPSLPIILGINEHPKLTEDKKLVPLERFGLKVMSFGFISGNETPTIWRGPLVSRMTEQFFHDVLWGELDYLILDLPPGTGDVQLTLTQKLRLSGAIIVTTPQDIALADVRKGADMFKKVQTPVLGVVENMSGLVLTGQLTGQSAHLDIDGIEDIAIDADGHFELRVDIFKKGGGEQESDRLGVPLLGTIPISKALMTATDSGEPIVLSHPTAPIACEFLRIAQRIKTALDTPL